MIGKGRTSMSKPTLIAILTAMISPALLAQHMTVDQLRDMLAAQKAAHKSDGDIAGKVAPVELTEQLTPPTLDKMEADLQLGPKTTEALALQADVSGFLDPPPAELTVRDPPDAAARDQIMRKAIEFAAITMHLMPDFLAIRATRSFDDQPLLISLGGWFPAQRDLHLAGTFTQQITYRDGHEVSDQGPPGEVSAPKPQASPDGLTTTGEFGPVLATVITDALKGQMTFSHWEQTSAGVTAVFHFQIPQDASHYPVNFCWIEGPRLNSYRHINDMADAQLNCYKGTPAYHGSISIDPATGTVLRIAIESDVPPKDRLARADLFVEFGTVEIGGRLYTCPVRSVAISLVRFPATEVSPARTMLCLNDATFSNYHRFGASVRVVPAH
jgi:hypothetical protein